SCSRSYGRSANEPRAAATDALAHAAVGDRRREHAARVTGCATGRSVASIMASVLPYFCLARPTFTRRPGQRFSRGLYVHESAAGTFETSGDVRSCVAIGGKPDSICSLRVLPVVTLAV